MAQSDGTFGSVVALVSCALQKGIAVALVQFVYQRGETIVDYDQWVDTRHNRFFARLEWSIDLGRELETMVLRRAVELHVRKRIIVDRKRTIIFD